MKRGHERRALRAKRNAGALLLCVAWTVACQPAQNPLDGLEPTLVGNNLLFYAEPSDAPLCGGTLPYMDGYVGELLKLHDLPRDAMVEYYWFAEDSERTLGICEDSFACALYNQIVTSKIPHEHELVHAVRSHFGFSQRFFEEGAAELWGEHTDTVFTTLYPVETGLEVSVTNTEQFNDQYYTTAGLFSSFVASEHGTDALVEIGKHAKLGSSSAEVMEAFDDVLGVPFADVVDDYEASDWSCQRSSYRDDTPACTIARDLDCAMAGPAGELTIAFDLSCASDHFIGPRDGIIWAEASFTLAANRFVRVLPSVPDADEEDVSLTIRQCKPGCHRDPLLFTPGFESELGMEAGRHLVRVEIPADGVDRGWASLTISNVCGI